MQKFIVIDTEGSGLFDYSKPADADGQPRLAALAIIYLDTDLNMEREYVALVKPDGWVMAGEALAINELTMDRLQAEGLPIVDVLSEYAAAIDAGYAVAAHNAQHDCKAMRAELRLAGLDDRFERTQNFCTMRKSVGIIPKENGKKGWPKLSEAKAFLKIEEDGHTALGDARAAAAVLRYLRDQGVDLTPEVHFANQAPDKGGKSSEVASPLARKSAIPSPVVGKVADQEIPS